ncbi:hypothetical protein ES705_25371 [subsurface metagenome]
MMLLGCVSTLEVFLWGDISSKAVVFFQTPQNSLILARGGVYKGRWRKFFTHPLFRVKPLSVWMRKDPSIRMESY